MRQIERGTSIFFISLRKSLKQFLCYVLCIPIATCDEDFPSNFKANMQSYDPGEP